MTGPHRGTSSVYLGRPLTQTWHFVQTLGDPPRPIRYTGPDDSTENIESITIEEAEALEAWVSNITVQPGNGRLGVVG